MKSDGVADFDFDLGDRCRRCDTAGQIRHIGRVIALGLFDDDCVAHQFRSLSPACLSTLFNVPGAMSSDGFPAMVTRPGFDACLYCRCDPRVATRNQSSSSIRLITSRTFTPPSSENEG